MGQLVPPMPVMRRPPGHPQGQGGRPYITGYMSSSNYKYQVEINGKVIPVEADNAQEMERIVKQFVAQYYPSYKSPVIEPEHRADTFETVYHVYDCEDGKPSDVQRVLMERASSSCAVSSSSVSTSGFVKWYDKVEPIETMTAEQVNEKHKLDLDYQTIKTDKSPKPKSKYLETVHIDNYRTDEGPGIISKIGMGTAKMFAWLAKDYIYHTAAVIMTSLLICGVDAGLRYYAHSSLSDLITKLIWSN